MVSTHKDIGKEKRKLHDVDESKSVSTRNLIPFKRQATKADVDRFVNRVKGKKEEKVEEAQPKRGRPRKESKDAVSKE